MSNCVCTVGSCGTTRGLQLAKKLLRRHDAPFVVAFSRKKYQVQFPFYVLKGFLLLLLLLLLPRSFLCARACVHLPAPARLFGNVSFLLPAVELHSGFDLLRRSVGGFMNLSRCKSQERSTTSLSVARDIKWASPARSSVAVSFCARHQSCITSRLRGP